jgi:hypothetical protein
MIRRIFLLDTILPDSFWSLLAAFSGCFGGPSFQNFCAVIGGWVQCLGRHTITAVALASGELNRRHISVFHRFFAQAQWALDSVGLVVWGLALPWIGADQPLQVLLDDTLARKSGKCISLASIHHDPLLSSSRKPFFSFGHVWVVLALWVPLPINRTRGFALPVLFRLYTGKRRGGQADAPSRRTTGQRQQAAARAAEDSPVRTKLELGRELIGIVAKWAGQRTVYVATDSAYAGRTILEQRPPHVEVTSRLRMDAALWTPPPARQTGQRGRPRRRGQRLPNPALWAATRRFWHRLTLTLYGRPVTTQVFHKTALWYVALRDQSVRIVIVRDPSGRRRDEAFFCTDVHASVAFILETYAHRWTLEVAFRDGKQHLGFEDPQQQVALAVRRTAPMAFIVYDLVLLWAASRVQAGQVITWVERPWYRHKMTPSFADLLTSLRHHAWRFSLFDPPLHARCREKSPSAWDLAVLATA